MNTNAIIPNSIIPGEMLIEEGDIESECWTHFNSHHRCQQWRSSNTSWLALSFL